MLNLVAVVMAEIASELALFAAAGFFVFAIDDLLVDFIYFVRHIWRSAVIYSRYPRTVGGNIPSPRRSGWIAVFVPAWEEASVIAPMLRATLQRFDHPDYRIFAGHYRNDPATAAAIRSVADPRIEMVEVERDGPTTKADCLNRLYAALIDHERARGEDAKAVVLHDAEDVVHPLELRIFDLLVERAGMVQLPVIPLIDPASRWVSGHYADEFAQAHMKELVVREAVGAAIPMAGVGCAIERVALYRLACRHDGKPFAGGSMTEDYEMGLRLGAIGVPTIFVRIPSGTGDGAAIATRGHFPATISAAVRQKARWIGGIAFAGWDRLGWRGGPGELWMRMRDRRGPLAALLLAAAYLGMVIWLQLLIAGTMGAPVIFHVSPALRFLLLVNAAMLGWRLLMRAGFTTAAYGWREGLRSVPRSMVGNIIAILAVHRALSRHRPGGSPRWDKTHHIFPMELPDS